MCYPYLDANDNVECCFIGGYYSCCSSFKEQNWHSEMLFLEWTSCLFTILSTVEPYMIQTQYCSIAILFAWAQNFNIIGVLIKAVLSWEWGFILCKSFSICWCNHKLLFSLSTCGIIAEILDLKVDFVVIYNLVLPPVFPFACSSWLYTLEN